MRISVVIAAYNEEEPIGEIVRSVARYVDEVVVVDNGSTDRTAGVARAAEARVVRQDSAGWRSRMN